ncbi:MAG: TolC family protein [Phycisphaerales bacterium]
MTETFSRIARASSLGLAIALTGCRSYEPTPLDLPAHRASWELRAPDDEPVLEYVARDDTLDTPIDFDVADGISLPEAELIALVYNPDLRVARLRAGVARAGAEHAGTWDDPELSIDVLRITESVPDPWIVGPSLAFTIPISGRLEAEKDRADAALRAELSRLAEAEWDVRMDVRRAWLRYSASVRRAEQLERLVDSVGSLLDSADRLADAGELPRTEAALFRIEHLGLRRDVARARGSAEEAELNLRGLLGLSPAAPLEMLPTLSAPKIDASQSIDTLVEQNLTLARLRDEYDIAEQTLRREIRKQYPDLVIGPQYESDEGQSRIGFLGAIPIPIFNANARGIAEAEAERELARAVFETSFERLAGAFEAARRRHELNRRQRELFETELAPIIDTQLGDARRLLELGEGRSLVLLESLSRAGLARTQLIEAALDEALALVDLAALLGPNPPRPTHTPNVGEEVTP